MSDDPPSTRRAPLPPQSASARRAHAEGDAEGDADTPSKRRVRCSLARRIRFAFPLDGPAGQSAGSGGQRVADGRSPRDNAFAAWPSTDLLAVHGEFIVEVSGDADPMTGYLISVAELDAAVRLHAFPLLGRAVAVRAAMPTSALVRAAIVAVAAHLPVRLDRMTLALGPYFSVRMDTADMTLCLLRQSFEFSAAHRLHCPALDAVQNRDLFGKCNNPNGHGHNYRLEVAVRAPLDDSGAAQPGLSAVESIVRRTVIDLLDHRHLNEDIAHFATVNPSVENIAAHCRDLLRPALHDAGGSLAWLTLWETEKTGCTVVDDDEFPQSAAAI